MREGRIQGHRSSSNEVLCLIKPLVESSGLGDWTGGRASLEVAGRGKVLPADTFTIFATRSITPSQNNVFSSPTFFGSYKFYEMIVSSPSIMNDLKIISTIRLAKDRIQSKRREGGSSSMIPEELDSQTPRKRRKVVSVSSLNASASRWSSFEHDAEDFSAQHVHGSGKFAFGFVEGPLVKALRAGDWILLDEINPASPETLECLSSILHSPIASITLTEQGSLEPVPRHPNLRLFACMNPATDVGKDLRSRFTEIDVPPPDADRDTLLSIITRNIGPLAVGDKAVIMGIADYYLAVKQLSESREITPTALQYAYFGSRAIWESCLMAFTMVLDAPSAEMVTSLAQRHLLSGVKNPKSILSREPSVPHGRSPDEFVKFGSFFLEKGPLPPDPVDEHIMTPSVEMKLIDLARIILTRRFPVLIEGPTSSSKTSSIEYLAKRTGHHFVRINNHEHTDIQEYISSYVRHPISSGQKQCNVYILVSRALKFDEPVLLVGETGYLIGGLRPVRDGGTLEANIICEAVSIFEDLGIPLSSHGMDSISSQTLIVLQSQSLDEQYRVRLLNFQRKLARVKSIFEWHDGPLVEAIRNRHLFLLDEISLADDSVLEPLNSVLEPSRSLVLAEKGGDDPQQSMVYADESFKLVATMNPGGDCGKKVLSPALRNRFTVGRESHRPTFNHQFSVEA
ncbi:AAA ATPase midasin [Stygiomarasmius scandens]|uniref:AAA ATPase midasin n=1 Tax=Marasmiellus scandens TaxID=2682957 RepID=A0ABR1IPK7_9AGAR